MKLKVKSHESSDYSAGDDEPTEPMAQTKANASAGGYDPADQVSKVNDPSGHVSQINDPTGQKSNCQDPTGQNSIDQDPTGQNSIGQDPTGQNSNSEDPIGCTRTIVFGEDELTVEDVWTISRRLVNVKLSEKESYCKHIEDGYRTVAKLLEENHIIYGVNTAYGNNCNVTISEELVATLPDHLVSHHECGMGLHFNEIETRSILVARVTSLARGHSGVRFQLLEQIIKFLQLDILPCIPCTGSVGASGDLTPLSYVAAALCGDRNVRYEGKLLPAEVVLKDLGISPLQLAPKEGLAIMNGTSVMTGLASLAYCRAQYLSKLCSRITSLAIVSLRGNLFHYDQTLFSVKPHPGQQEVAARIRSDLLISDAPADYNKIPRIQDRYSIRCAPHVIGVLEDSLPFFRKLIETELNSSNDNPIIDVPSGRVFHGGMFYGGHIAFAMDGMKVLIANLADLLDRQMALLVDTNYNHGLPANLSGSTGKSACLNHGLKGLQISCSAWTGEALKNTVAASIFSRSTEGHNQDKVSMGTISARDCLQILELSEQVAAGLLIAVRQGIAIRTREDPLYLVEQYPLGEDVQLFFKKLEQIIPFVIDGVRIEPVLRKLMCIIQNQELELY